MQLGQTSVIYYFSKLSAALLGFGATIYIARTLGPDPLGIYHVALGLVSWIAIFGNIGISNAVTKRISEGTDQGAYTAASIVIILSLFVIATAGIFFFRERVVNYIEYPVTVFIILFLFIVLINNLVSSLLEGLHLVHVSGILSTVRTGGRAIAQITLITAGLGTASLFIGHIVGYVIVIGIGAYYIVRKLPSFQRPEKRHFSQLTDFAKFSWLGGLQSQMFSYTDILVLRLFVSSGLIGVYAAAWNIAHFLIIFSGTLQTTLFPEMSAISVQDDPQAVSRIVEQSLAFGGLFLIPGMFGGVLLGERILRIYGPEFPQGALILSILIVANLFMGYQNQLLNTLNAIDRPDLAFRVNVVFVVVNVCLNVGLIYLYGWLGAAVATAASAAVSLVLAYQYIDTIINFDIPLEEIARQWLAGGVMSIVVYGGLLAENTYRIISYNFVVVTILVTLGAGVYFVVLLGLSTEFRETVDRNIPVDVPFVSR